MSQNPDIWAADLKYFNHTHKIGNNMRCLTYDECNNQVTMYMYIKTLHCTSLIYVYVFMIYILIKLTNCF